MLINKEELLKALQDDNGLQYPRWWYLEKVREMSEAVVMCKNCRYYNREHSAYYDGYCNHFEMCLIGDDGFCSDAERREDG